MPKRNRSEFGTISPEEYKRPEKWTDSRRKWKNKRRVTPGYWYIMLLSDPSRPWVMWKPFPDKISCQQKIDEEFGNNSLFYPVLGRYIIRYGVLLSRTIRRRLGKIPQYRAIGDERQPTTKLKGLEKY